MIGLIPGLNQFPLIVIQAYKSPILSNYIKDISNNIELKPSDILDINLEKEYINDSNIYDDLTFTKKDTLSGELFLNLKDVKIDSFEHNGITIELICIMKTIDGYSNKLLHLTKELDCSGIISKNASYGFSFNEVEFPYESYKGELAEIKYILKGTVGKNFLNIKSTDELEFNVVFIDKYEGTPSYPLKVGFASLNIINCELQILEAVLQKEDVLVGTLKIKEVNIQTKSIFIELVKREFLVDKFNESVITKYQIVEGEVENNNIIPIRLYLRSYKLTPTYTLINNMFTVKYFIKILIEDANNEQTYSMSEEIVFHR